MRQQSSDRAGRRERKEKSAREESRKREERKSAASAKSARAGEESRERKERREREEKRQQGRQNAAATKIQGGYRGKKAREEVKAKRQAKRERGEEKTAPRLPVPSLLKLLLPRDARREAEKTRGDPHSAARAQVRQMHEVLGRQPQGLGFDLWGPVVPQPAPPERPPKDPFLTPPCSGRGPLSAGASMAAGRGSAPRTRSGSPRTTSSSRSTGEGVTARAPVPGLGTQRLRSDAASSEGGAPIEDRSA